MKRLVIGEDRLSRVASAMVEVEEEKQKSTVLGKNQRPKGPETIEHFVLEIRGTTWQNRPGRKTMWRVYVSGREERII